jgi:prepilin peptidase CpaA
MTIWIYLLILVELTIVSWFDIKIKKISNAWFVVNAVIAIVFHYLYPEVYPWELATFLFPSLWLLGGFLLFLLNIMGAGDSKYLASLFLIIPGELQISMLEKLIYTTCIVGFIMLLIKFIKDFQKIKAYAFSVYWGGLKEAIKSNFSYAPVIWLAWVVLGAGQWK